MIINGLGQCDCTDVLQDLADLDTLAEQLSQSYAGSALSDIDVDKLARQLGDDAAVSAPSLAELDQALGDSGLLRRGSTGDLRLSPQAIRRLGKTLLQDAARLSDRQGQRDTRHAGAAGELTGATRTCQSGDPGRWTAPGRATKATTPTARQAPDPRPGPRRQRQEDEHTA